MYKWTAYFILWVATVIIFQLFAVRAIEYAVDLKLDLDWEHGLVTPIDDGLPDLQ